MSINFIVDFCPHLGSFCCFSLYVSAKFNLWPSSGLYRICNCLYWGFFFEMRLLNLSINFIADICPDLGSFCCFQHRLKYFNAFFPYLETSMVSGQRLKYYNAFSPYLKTSMVSGQRLKYYNAFSPYIETSMVSGQRLIYYNAFSPYLETSMVIGQRQIIKFLGQYQSRIFFCQIR